MGEIKIIYINSTLYHTLYIMLPHIEGFYNVWYNNGARYCIFYGYPYDLDKLILYRNRHYHENTTMNDIIITLDHNHGI